MSSSFASVRNVRHLAEESCAAIVTIYTAGRVPSVSRSMNSAATKSNPYTSTVANRWLPVPEWATERFHCSIRLETPGPEETPLGLVSSVDP